MNDEIEEIERAVKEGRLDAKDAYYMIRDLVLQDLADSIVPDPDDSDECQY